MFGFKEIDIEGLKSAKSQEGVLLIDVRTDAEVARGMIEGAKHIPLHLLPLKANELNAGVPTIFYCQSGARSAQACAFMSSKGHDDVYNLQGGILAWMRDGMPLAAMC
ncbi:rhodanese-like domain-containing protein [Sulfurirhabdus autotrophica]|uniref:Rhodanese-related sulfurtransferase n=1 Tax=Sulfurirhabdus autotrophica TaxID=1706046 RepID=A0A4V2W116_9PROT|nr:rhodanese-like domain-containing protein [Sulfurirhabdus autotrophica]TCV82539.1 rhodanese-related sulfurtransferase [Sulfurirhabdus autotrophica]